MGGPWSSKLDVRTSRRRALSKGLTVTNWSAICPPSPIKDVEDAGKRVLDLRGRVDEQRDAVEAAKRDLAAAEQADKTRMARELAEGRAPTSDTKTVEQLRAALGA